MPGFMHFFKLVACLSMLFSVVLASAVAEDGAGEAVPQLRRLNEQQYRNSIADIFGENITITGRFEPELRNRGLLALGSSIASVTPFGFEQFDTIGRSVAQQFVDQVKQNPAQFCDESGLEKITKSCVQGLLMGLGGQLFRRPLSDNEQSLYVGIFTDLHTQQGKIYSALESTLSGMLVAPPFIFRIEDVEPDPGHIGQFRLTAYAKAQRLSYFLWNTTPDQVLLAAARRGDLHRRPGLNKQVNRLLDSPRLETGVRALFSDILHFDEFDKLVKDPKVFPRFNFKTAEDAREETLRTITDHLLMEKGDYRELFTTRKTFMTTALSRIYRVRVTHREGWAPYTFTDASDYKAGARAGLLTQVSFLALHSHPGRSSATLRGKAVRELILCQKVPTPPANVDFNVVQDTSNPKFKTTRERVMAHQTDPACASCHKITDPIGLALEHFDGSGVFRKKENGAAIDTSGVLDGQEYTDAAGLGQAVADHPDTPECLIRRSFESGTGHILDRDKKDWLKSVSRNFSSNGYTLPGLLKQLVTSEEFYAPLLVQPKDLATVALAPVLAGKED